MPTDAAETPERSTITIRKPTNQHGSKVWDLISKSGSLDENSMYCNLLQCTHFSQTCAIATEDGRTVGWVSGYIPPEQPDTLFIWQVCVHHDARGKGLGKRLIRDILARPVCRDVRFVDTTITRDNASSWSLFRKVAESLGAPMEDRPHFDRDAHFAGSHDTEHLVRIGPFGTAAANGVAGPAARSARPAA